MYSFSQDFGSRDIKANSQCFQCSQKLLAGALLFIVNANSVCLDQLQNAPGTFRLHMLEKCVTIHYNTNMETVGAEQVLIVQVSMVFALVLNENLSDALLRSIHVFVLILHSQMIINVTLHWLMFAFIATQCLLYQV